VTGELAALIRVEYVFTSYFLVGRQFASSSRYSQAGTDSFWQICASVWAAWPLEQALTCPAVAAHCSETTDSFDRHSVGLGPDLVSIVPSGQAKGRSAMTPTSSQNSLSSAADIATTLFESGILSSAHALRTEAKKTNDAILMFELMYTGSAIDMPMQGSFE
jgi:hypothetical protein